MFINMGLARASYHKMLSLLLMFILTLILLLILVDFKTHVTISVSHDANLGARSSLFIANTTANRNCDADINRNTSITANKIQLQL